MFIVHSLGGLVLKEVTPLLVSGIPEWDIISLTVSKALNQSCGTQDERRRRVVESTQGIIFLGTPHKGSSVASYGKIAFQLAKIFAFQSANTKLLQALEKNSETLDRITTAFYETLSKHRSLRIVSFFEEKETRRGVFGTRIVPPDCARIGHVHEEWGGIPANHRHMAKFKSDKDTGFKKVSNIVKQWVAAIEDESTSKSGLRPTSLSSMLIVPFSELAMQGYQGTLRCLRYSGVSIA